jgi:hypothetical protein
MEPEIRLRLCKEAEKAEGIDSYDYIVLLNLKVIPTIIIIKISFYKWWSHTATAVEKRYFSTLLRLRINLVLVSQLVLKL